MTSAPPAFASLIAFSIFFCTPDGKLTISSALLLTNRAIKFDAASNLSSADCVAAAVR